MITVNGKNIIAKYLLNQAPEFASHIAVGVGGYPISTSSSVTFDSDANSLNFEAYRIPVLSKGLIKEDNIEKIVFKAELPSDQRLMINEIGLYPAESNKLAENYGSKIVASFNNSEQWVYSKLGSASVVTSIGQIPINNSFNGQVGDYLDSGAPLPKFSFIDSNSTIFEFSNRKQRGEQPRYLGKALMASGGFSSLDSSFNMSSSATLNSYYLENNSIRLNLGRNLPTDEIKIAFSVMNKVLGDVNIPDFRMRLELINSTNANSKAYVNMSLTTDDFLEPITDHDNRRYQVITKTLSDFVTDTNFSWSSIDLIRIYGCVSDDGNEEFDPDQYFIIFDGIRFENISTKNPLYSLVAAEYIKTIDQVPVLKKENSTGYIEYRLGLDI